MVPFPVERARRGERPQLWKLVQLERKLERIEAAHAARWNDPAVVFARFLQLMELPGPRAFGLLIAGLVVSFVALENLGPGGY